MKTLSLFFTYLTLVATAFASDNSGETSGLLLSLRFPTNVFVSGQSIEMTAVLQNTTTNSMAVPFVRNNSLDLFVLDQNKEPLIATNRLVWHTYSGPSSVLLSAGKQTTYHYQLDDIFALGTPGEYYVYAKTVKFRGPWEKLSTIQSETFKITIVAPSSSASKINKTQQ
jgi:hypothetical protein